MNQNLDMSIIAGDFNFGDGAEENKAIEEYVDVWKMGKGMRVNGLRRSKKEQDSPCQMAEDIQPGGLITSSIDQISRRVKKIRIK